MGLTSRDFDQQNESDAPEAVTDTIMDNQILFEETFDTAYEAVLDEEIININEPGVSPGMSAGPDEVDDDTFAGTAKEENPDDDVGVAGTLRAAGIATPTPTSPTVELMQDNTASGTLQDDVSQENETTMNKEVPEAVEDMTLDGPTTDNSQERSGRNEDTRQFEEEAIEKEVWEEFRLMREMNQREMSKLNEGFSTELQTRLHEVQQHWADDNDTHENKIEGEMEEKVRPDREKLRNEIDKSNEAYTQELSRRLHEFRERRWRSESAPKDDTREFSGWDSASQTSDISQIEDKAEEMDGDPEDEVDGVGTPLEEGIPQDEDYWIEERSIQPSNERTTGDPGPAPFYEASPEAHPIDSAERTTITMAQENLAHHMGPQQASADPINRENLPDEDTNADSKSVDNAESSGLVNNNSRGDDGYIDHRSTGAQAPTGSTGQQEGSIESNESESQQKVAGGSATAKEPGGGGSTFPPGQTNAAEDSGRPERTERSRGVDIAEEAQAMGDMALAGGNMDSGVADTALVSKMPSGNVLVTTNTVNDVPTSSGPANNIPARNVLTSNPPVNNMAANTVGPNTVAANIAPARHGPQRRTRQHEKKARAEMYGVKKDNDR